MRAGPGQSGPAGGGPTMEVDSSAASWGSSAGVEWRCGGGIRGRDGSKGLMREKATRTDAKPAASIPIQASSLPKALPSGFEPDPMRFSKSLAKRLSTAVVGEEGNPSASLTGIDSKSG